jgi:hypothetical protein
MAMQANKHISAIVVGDVDVDLTPFLKRYKDGRIERLLKSPFTTGEVSFAECLTLGKTT